MATNPTPDSLALQILLSDASDADKQAKLAALARVLERQLLGGECPECGHVGPHDDNGHTGADRSFCCVRCGTQWDAS